MRRWGMSCGVVLVLAGLALAQQPVTPILDDCNRTEDPLTLGGAWDATSVSGGTNGWEANGTTCERDTGSSQNDIITWGTVLGADHEVYLTVPVVSSIIRLGVRLQQTQTAGWDGYTCRRSTTPNIQIARVDDGVETTLGATIAGDLSANDVFRCTIVGDTISAYQNTTLLGSRTDSTYTGGGKIGVGATNATFRGDTLGGGTLRRRLWVVN